MVVLIIIMICWEYLRSVVNEHIHLIMNNSAVYFFFKHNIGKILNPILVSD